MNTLIDSDVHFHILKLIIQNVDELLTFVGNKQNLSEIIKDSVNTIFEFIDKIVDILPEMTTTNSNNILILKEMKQALHRINYVWNDEFTDIYFIKKEWDSFLYWWFEYFKGYYHLEEMKQGLNLSLN